MPTLCQNCNDVIDEMFETVGNRQPCPNCGSLQRSYDELLADEFSTGALMHTKGYAGGISRKKGLRFESKDGDSFSWDLGRFVAFNQLVDHDKNRYAKKIIDPLTRDILREVDEPLSEHKNRGSAKPRNP